MKNNKGITLIALIITIIVLIILAAVTVSVALEGRLFNKAKEASFKTRVRQIQESVLIAKTEKIAENNGNKPVSLNISWDDLEIDSQTKAEFQQKLSINSGKLYYNENNVTAQEKKWLEDLGITAEVENGYNVIKLAWDYHQENPNSYIYSAKTAEVGNNILPDNLVVILNRDGGLIEFPECIEDAQDDDLIFSNDLLNFINELKSSSFSFDFYDETYLKDVPAFMSELQSYGYSEENTVLPNCTIEEFSLFAIMMSGKMDFVCLNEDSQVLISHQYGTKDITSYKQIMTKNEFDELYNYTVSNYQGNVTVAYQDVNRIKITGYKSSDYSNIVIPGFVYAQDGEIYTVTGIDEYAFSSDTMIADFTIMPSDNFGIAGLVVDNEPVETTKSNAEAYASEKGLTVTFDEIDSEDLRKTDLATKNRYLFLPLVRAILVATGITDTSNIVVGDQDVNGLTDDHIFVAIGQDANSNYILKPISSPGNLTAYFIENQSADTIEYHSIANVDYRLKNVTLVFFDNNIIIRSDAISVNTLENVNVIYCHNEGFGKPEGSINNWVKSDSVTINEYSYSFN